MSDLPDFRIRLSDHLYGPVRSRRHGRSLGVNLGSDQKICSWSCLYCQYGFGRTIRAAETPPAVPAERIFAEIREQLERDPKIDSLTFAGNSEPGLYPELLALLKRLKRHQVSARAKWKIIILSNGSELHRDDVVQAFNLADETWLKLDCGREESFHRLNRPVPFRQGLGQHLTRLRQIRQLYLQSMLWFCPHQPELSNSRPEDLEALLECYQLLQPKKIHLYTIDRAPAYARLARLPSMDLSEFAQRIRERDLECEVFI